MKYIMLALSVVLLSACSSAPSQGRDNGRVVEVVGIVIVSEEAPLVCGVDRSNQTNPLLATVVGGLIGNQFGGGSGRTVATVLGSGAGYQYASSRNRNQDSRHDCRRDGWISQIQYTNPVNGQRESVGIKTDRGLQSGQRVRTNVRVYY